MVYSAVVFCMKEVLELKKTVDFLKRNILKIEMICLILSISTSLVLQVFVDKCDLTQYITWEWIFKLYRWILNLNVTALLEEVDKIAIIIGGLSFITEKWEEKDTENTVSMLVIIFSLVLAKVFNIMHLNIMSFIILCTNALLILIPIVCIVYDCLKNSHNRNIKRNKKVGRK